MHSLSVLLSRWAVIFCSLLLAILGEAKEKICLNMIVKDESLVIKRCLESVKPLIDYWVIVDTGSKDGTQAIIKQFLKDIPGELHERPWKNFGVNRTEAFELAKGKADYILFMDADDILEFKDKVQFGPLTKDLYNMWRGNQEITYVKPQLARANLPWRWVGVTHEYLDCAKPYTSETLSYVKYITCDGGASSFDPEKYTKNIRLLEQGIKEEPSNDRYAFYLAESYRCANKNGMALEWYQNRVNMGGWDEEIYWSKLQIAQLLERMGFPANVVIDSYLNAHKFRPHRVESIYYLADYLNKQGNYKGAYAYLKAFEVVPKPAESDTLFNLVWINEYGLLFQLSICSFYLGHYQESLNACNRLLQMKNLPDEWRNLTEKNRAYPVEKLRSQDIASSP